MPSPTPQDPVRVVHLATYGGPYAGSFIPTTRALARAVRDRGWSFEIAFSPIAQGRPWLSELAADEIPVSFMPARTWPDGFIWLSRRLRADGARTVVHSHFSGYDLVAAAAGASARPRSAVFWHGHSRMRSEAVVRARNVVKFGVLSRGVDQILCVAPDIAEAVRNRGARPGHVRFLPNAIDLDRFPPPTTEQRRRARQLLELPPEATVLLHFGWDWERKGGDIFLRAVRQARARENPADLLAVTVGGGSAARAQVTALGLDGAVRVLEARDDVWTFYAAADIFVSPSRAEGMPYSMLEALATGLRVVASDIPGQRLVGQDLAACLLVSLDVDAVATGVSAQVRASEAGSTDVLAIRRDLGRRVDLTAWARTVVDLYSDALRPHSR